MTDDPARKFSPEDLEDLRLAVDLLENPGLAARLADLIGTPIEKLMDMLPDAAGKMIGALTEKALGAALDLAVATMAKGKCQASPRTHKLASAVAGAVGGAAGLPGLAIELPVTTTIIFRAIADIARAEDEDLREPEACVACLEVFALGGPKKSDDAAESGYFAARVALAKSVHEAARYLVRGVAGRKTAPAIVQLINKLASRFGIAVSSKAAAQLVPLIGAIGGAAINTIFMDHFQNMAKGHFIVRRLERSYGHELVRECYNRLMTSEPDAPSEPLDVEFELLDHKPIPEETKDET